MEVILKEDVHKLGHRGDVVKVADGYGRNYLLPEKLAIEATSANKARDRADEAARRCAAPRRRRRSQQLVAQLEQVELGLRAQGGRERAPVWFGDLARTSRTQLEQKGFTVDRRKMQLDEPLKRLGEFHVPVKLHREVTAISRSR